MDRKISDDCNTTIFLISFDSNLESIWYLTFKLSNLNLILENWSIARFDYMLWVFKNHPKCWLKYDMNFLSQTNLSTNKRYKYPLCIHNSNPIFFVFFNNFDISWQIFSWIIYSSEPAWPSCDYDVWWEANFIKR